MKRAFTKLIWLLISIAGAVSIAIVTGIFNPAEKVNALWLITAAGCFYVITYRFYASFLAAKVLSLDPGIQTPAHILKDGVDYHPTNRWVLFGHHFAAIAGAGPLVGPVLAAQFGYLPGTLWLIIGVVLGGAVQDFVILFASMRRDGKSLGQMVREEVGPFAGLLALVSIIALMVILIAGLALVVVAAEEALAIHAPPGSRDRIACAEGCGTCCVVNVAVLYPEAVAIAEYLRRTRSAAELETLTERLEELYRQVVWLDDDERVMLRRPCVFLDEAGNCSVYPVRPLLCRSMTSTSAEGCRQAIASQAFGENTPILVNLFQKDLMDEAFKASGRALSALGLDGRGVKLTVAMRQLLSESGAVEAYLAGGAVPSG